MGQLNKFLQKRAVYHSFLWFIYALLMLLLNENHEQWWFSISNVLIHTIFVAALVYYNFYYLIPLYLSRKRFLLYAFWLAFATLIITPLELIILFWNLSGRPTAQANLIDNQGSHYLVLLLVVSFSSVLRIIKYWFVQEQAQRDLERQNLQSELSFLKSQINPHFLFNTLNSLYALTLKKSEQAPEVVLRLSEMMRYMLYECNEKYVSLQQELQYIKNYLALEQVRYGQKAVIEFDYLIDEVDKYKVAPLLFITFLENSFKHGLSHRIEAGFVTVYLQVEAGALEFHVDNSKADKRDEAYYQGGIGLKNVGRRLDLLYPARYQLDFEQDEQTYSVHLSLDLTA